MKTLAILALLSTALYGQSSVSGYPGGTGANIGTPSVMLIQEEFASAGVTSGTVGSLSWNFSTITTAPAVTEVAGSWPHLGILSFSTNAAPAQNGGGSLQLNPNTVDGVLGNLGGNVPWEETWIFQFQSATSNASRIGFIGTHGVLRPITSVNLSGIWLRADQNNPLSSGAITSLVCTSSVCTVTMTGAHNLVLIGQTVTISGETCPTRNVNAAQTVATITSTTAWTFNAAGNAETCTVQGTATSSAMNDFFFETNNASGLTADTAVDSGIAIDTNWHTLKISSVTAGTIVFQLDNGATTSITTNAPTANIMPAAIVGTDISTQRTVFLDYFFFRAFNLAR